MNKIKTVNVEPGTESVIFNIPQSNSEDQKLGNPGNSVPSGPVANLYRFTTGPNGTPGVLMCPGGLILHTLELPWRNNKKCISCIPKGTYNYKFLKKTGTGKFKNVYHVQSVKGRTGILIHNGNYLRQILGCVLVGKQTGYKNNEYTVWDSKTALSLLNTPKGFGKKSGTLIVHENYYNGG